MFNDQLFWVLSGSDAGGSGMLEGPILLSPGGTGSAHTTPGTERFFSVATNLSNLPARYLGKAGGPLPWSNLGPRVELMQSPLSQDTHAGPIHVLAAVTFTKRPQALDAVLWGDTESGRPRALRPTCN